MLRGALAVVTFIAGMIVGAGALATATSAPAATAVPPTATVRFARYGQIDAIGAFTAAGLVAGPVTKAEDRLLPNRPNDGTAYVFLNRGSGGGVPFGYVIETTSSGQVAAWQRYFDGYSGGPLLRARYQIRGNLLLAFVYTTQGEPPDMSQYWAVFAALP